ncbi:kinase-like protein [Marasmius fiardii PR-910]|nr:kinase-like protein [Marasmius fiardii PR-910]
MAIQDDETDQRPTLWTTFRKDTRAWKIFPPQSHSLQPLLPRSRSSPPSFRSPFPCSGIETMLSTSTSSQFDLAFDNNEDWKSPSLAPRMYRAASVGSWGVTSFGRGFDWEGHEDSGSHKLKASSQRQESTSSPKEREPVSPVDNKPLFYKLPTNIDSSISRKSPASFPSVSPSFPSKVMHVDTKVAPAPVGSESFYMSPTQSRSPSPAVSTNTNRPPLSRSPSTPRPRRRSSQQRVSLIAGRVSIAPLDSPTIVPPNLVRVGSTSSLLSTAASTRAPSPSNDEQSFLGSKRISDFHIEGEIGRGAYGLVKRGREIKPDGSLGPPVVIKLIIKSRILADCWKKHPKLGTIPIEIYVMSAISNTAYVLPPRRPWDPSRSHSELKAPDDWIEGKVVKGHPNICPLLDFFEDSHYYYIILPSTTPEPRAGEPEPHSDLFDLVESFPNGLPPKDIRSYLGQIADALTFLHSHGIVHRDVKDENVVLGANGRGILIDFGSAGLVRKGGWDSFSGTLDYAGPEILRGERYQGKEQDVWAFGVVAYVLLVGECPFVTAAEAQEGLSSPFANASISLDERCSDEKEFEGEEEDGGGALGDAAVMVRACLQLEPSARPTFEKILQSRFLAGKGGWGMARPSP